MFFTDKGINNHNHNLPQPQIIDQMTEMTMPINPITARSESQAERPIDWRPQIGALISREIL